MNSISNFTHEGIKKIREKIKNFIDETLKEEIREKIEKAINETLKNNLSEPHLIKILIDELVNNLNSIKNKKNGNIFFNIYSGGIFIHQRPKVKNIKNKNWKNGKGYVELGDLLLINTIVYELDIIQRSALLMQAKKGNINKIITPDNYEQLDLYTTWPEFEYVSSGILKGKKRHIDREQDSNKDIDNGAKYLFINTNNTLPKTSVAAATKLELSELKDFIDEIYDFIKGSAGKEFCLKKEEDKDIGWDRVITDMIDNISILALPESYQRAEHSEEKRGVGLCRAPFEYLEYKGFESTPIIGKILEISSIIDESNNTYNTNDRDEISGISMIEIIIKIDDFDIMVI